MKIARILLVILVLGAVLALLPGCQKADAGNETPSTQTAQVTRGNLTQEISAAGNLALSNTKDVAVELFYPAGTKGTIGEVLVEEGDTVIQGQVLVTLDKNEWNDQLAALEDAVVAKERALVQSRINLKTAEQALKNSRDAVNARELSVLNAQISVQQAESVLAAGIAAVDYNAALAELRAARTWLDYINTTYKTFGKEDYLLTLENAEQRYTIAKTNYDNITSGYNSQEMNLKKNQVKAAEMSLEAAKEDLIDAQDDVPLKELSLTLSQGNLEDAEKALLVAKNNLANAQAKSPEIVAPFDGFITTVNVAGGDQVLSGAIAVQVADPDKFEADILVSEVDIPKVTVGGKATVILDAMPGTILFATVKKIAPTATISSGVVNYIVKVEVQSPGSNPFANLQIPAGDGDTSIPSFPGAVPGDGEAPALSGDFKFGDFKMPEGSEASGDFKFPAFSGNQSFGDIPLFGNNDVQLRQGLTVTVTIIVASGTDVLMVPNGAIVAEGFKNYVQLIKADGTPEKREVTTGISNWMFTEITDGVTEGEQVQVTLNSAPDFDFPRGGMMFMGG